ncbi:glycosyl-4,4'-diaponeurosporenoate acyltransferase CrtO family protein [Rossellomorea marisflavi]|uniref:glycosyl-4,4'-diaponeurosporenoate acyltransferase CrtO family protein n=1 Tax=Rossellomorea marisflavi TaxID=189381 RepID=UPI0009A5B9A6|nr:hypothetical protein [Rossellomorea marisflavi]
MILYYILAWLGIHLLSAYGCSHLKERSLLRLTHIFKPRDFEGAGWFRVLAVRRWKSWFPDAGGWFRNGVSKKEIGLTRHGGRTRFLAELNRAELCHWLQLIPSPFFILFGGGVIGWWMGAYGIAFNLPLILIQRYNRKRLLGIMQGDEPIMHSSLGVVHLKHKDRGSPPP